jgi:perosamine synthetase
MNFFNTTITDDAILNASTTLKSGFISAGRQADDFECQLSAKLGLVNPVTVNSGTVTMFLALKALGVGPGDEVIIPAQTFVATGLAVLQCGARPVFADINMFTGNIDVDDVRINRITERTKAIIPVHWGGYPCDIDALNALNIPVIEDAAHALGAVYKGQPIGSISRFTSFSFQAIKHLTTGDGGALCCQSQEDADLIRKLRWFGIDRENSKPSVLGEREYDLSEVGYKAHMNDLAATIGLGNLLGFEAKINRIRTIAKTYDNGLKNITGLKQMFYKWDRKSSYWLYPILVSNRTDFIAKLKEKGIPTSVVHLGIDKNTIFGGIDHSLVSQRYFDQLQIHIPIHDALTDDDVELIIDTIKSGW